MPEQHDMILILLVVHPREIPFESHQMEASLTRIYCHNCHNCHNSRCTTARHMPDSQQNICNCNLFNPDEKHPAVQSWTSCCKVVATNLSSQWICLTSYLSRLHYFSRDKTSSPFPLLSWLCPIPILLINKWTQYRKQASDESEFNDNISGRGLSYAAVVWVHIEAHLHFLQNVCKFWCIRLIFTSFCDIFLESFKLIVDSWKYSLYSVKVFCPIL